MDLSRSDFLLYLWNDRGVRKKFSLLLIVLIMSTCSNIVWAVDLSNDDAKAHAGMSFAINSALYLSLRNARWSKYDALMTSAAITAFIGVLKEVNDSPMTRSDLDANGLGIGASFLVFFAVDWR